MSNAFDVTVNCLRASGLSSDQILEELSSLFEMVTNLSEQYVIKNTVEVRIRTLLNSLGMPINIDGYEQWVHAVEFYHSRKNRTKMKDVYKYVAEKYGSTPERVERAMRFAVKSAFDNCKNENIKQLFARCISEKTGRPRNRNFIAVMAEQI